MGDKKNWEQLVNTGGMVRSTKTGQYRHKQHFLMQKEFESKRPPPPVINLRCYDVLNGSPVMIVKVKPGTVFSDPITDDDPEGGGILELLAKTYGHKTLFEYQEASGKLVRVDDMLKWERFCKIADDSVRLGQQPTMDVFVQPWTYVEPTLFALGSSKTQGGSGSASGSAKQPPPDPSQWASGLMGCSGAPLMLFACVCPCVVAANIAVALGADSLCQAAASSLCISSLLDRQRVRKVYGIAGSDVSDCVAASCCAACSLSQLLLHLRAHPLPPPPPPTAAWPVRLFDVRKAGFCSRCCWSLCCSPCAFAQIQERKRLGGEHDNGGEGAGEKQQVEPNSPGNRRCTSACVVACSTVCVGWLVWRSRMHTRAALHIAPGKYACLSDCAAALCCTSFALVQEAAAWGLYEQADASEQDASEHAASEHAAPQDDQGDTPKTKNCMSCMPSASKPA